MYVKSGTEKILGKVPRKVRNITIDKINAIIKAFLVQTKYTWYVTYLRYNGELLMLDGYDQVCLIDTAVINMIKTNLCGLFYSKMESVYHIPFTSYKPHAIKVYDVDAPIKFNILAYSYGEINSYCLLVASRNWIDLINVTSSTAKLSQRKLSQRIAVPGHVIVSLSHVVTKGMVSYRRKLEIVRHFLILKNDGSLYFFSLMSATWTVFNIWDNVAKIQNPFIELNDGKIYLLFFARNTNSCEQLSRIPKYKKISFPKGSYQENLHFSIEKCSVIKDQIIIFHNGFIYTSSLKYITYKPTHDENTQIGILSPVQKTDIDISTNKTGKIHNAGC